MNRGDLIQTQDGYIGIITDIGTNITCFMGNGTRMVFQPNEISLYVLSTPTNFVELVDADRFLKTYRSKKK